MTHTLIFLSLFVLAGAGLAAAQSNPGLLNIREIQPTGHLGIHGDAGRVALFEDEVVSWLEEQMNEADFGAAEWTGIRSDSLAFLDVNVQIVPQGTETLLATVIFQVLRPGFILDVPPEDAVFDVPVMHTAYTLSGSEDYLRGQLQSLIAQFVQVTSERIRQHNPR